MKIKAFLTTILLGASAVTSSQQINPITQAMLDGYQQILDQNPEDYFTLYQRSAQFYRLSFYDKAADDIEKAISCTPKKEKDMLAQEYSLAADIYIEFKNYQKALAAVNLALANDPDSYPLLYKKGNICLYLKDTSEAKKCFAAMQRMQSRSQEAFFGLAKTAVLENNFNEAKTLIAEAEKCDPSNYITYCRTGDLYSDMGDYQLAASAYLSAFGLADKLERPMNSLIEISKSDYDNVSEAIDYALSKTSNTIPLYFLKGNIAYLNGKYGDAYTALRNLSDSSQQEGSIYNLLAKTCLMLDKPAEASKYARLATATGDNPDYQITYSEVDLASGLPDSALTHACKALETSPLSTDANIAAAKSRMAVNDWNGAISYLNDAIINDADAPLPLMLRAYIYNNHTNNANAAVSDYARVAKMPADGFPGILYKSLAQTLSGKKIDGDSTMSSALDKNSSPDAYFYAAVYYSQTGALEQAKSYLDKAIENGYENMFNINKDTTANLNIKPIRHLR